MKRDINHLCGLMVFLVGAFTSSTQLAFSQAAGSASGQAASEVISLARNTPQPVMNGAAQLVTHYNPAQMLRLALGLRHPNSAAEEQFLADVQDRNSPLFHHFLTASEWTARFSPSAQDEQAVVDWATAQGLTVTQRYPSRLLVDVEGPVSTVEKAFGMTINTYQLGANSFFSNDRDPVVPSTISNVLESVMGTNNLQVVQPAIRNFKGDIGGNPYAPGPLVSTGVGGQKEAEPAKAAVVSKNGVTPNITNGYYDPTDIFASTAYNYQALNNQGHCCNPTHNANNTPADTSIAIATFSSYDKANGKYKGGFNNNDIYGFQAQYPYLATHWAGPVNIDGLPGECCDDETTLDIEWATATSNSFGSYVDTAFIYTYIGGNNLLSTFNDVYARMSSDGVARVFSTSWGCSEGCWGGSAGVSTAHGIFNSMVGQGWTLVAASDDSGSTADCSTVSVDFPASDPNVVAAGGTTLYTGPGGYSSETGWTGGTGTGSCSVNNGGSGGGCSAVFAAPGYQTTYGSPACGTGSRSVPDLSLNASVGQNYYFSGGLHGVGGTSIVAPELAGFFAQEEAYMLYITTIIGSNSCYGGASSPCLPLGNGNTYLYWFGTHPTYAPHYPFYDITSGCNSNDVTASKHLTYYCAGNGYDLVTGWGSANMLQLSWAINSYLAGDFGAPTVTFSGPVKGHWYNTDQTVSWTIHGTSTDGNPVNGIAGYTAQWDATISDPFSEPHPGSGNAFYSGPANPNASSGSTDVASIGQGCHTVYVYAWDNAGYPSGNQAYGSVCYDVTAPVTTATLNGTFAGSEYDGPVQVTLNRSDNASGVAVTYYQVDGGGLNVYSSPFTVSGVGAHTVLFHSVDVAGNVESTKSASFTIRTAGSGALYFIPVTPCRVADTRSAPGPFGGPELAAGSTRNFVIPSSACGIPSSAASYSLNITVVPDAQLGYLTVWPAGQPQPVVSTLNSDGRYKANAAIVPAGSSGAVSVYASDSTQLIMDIDGYFVEAGSSTSGLAFYKTTPCRLVDTRQSPSSLGGPFLAGGTSRQFPLLSGSCGIPSSAAAYSLNYTAIPHSGLTYLTTWPSGQPQPVVSTLNAPTGTITANAAIVPAGSGGNVSVYVSDDTDLLIDINGYFAAPASGGLSLYSLTPCRALDTRSSSGQFSGAIAVNVVGSGCAVPGTAQAYVLNATVVPPAPLFYLTLWPNGQPQPVASTLNALDGAITSNMAIVPTTNGFINAYASDATQLILDISSYFAP